MKSLASRASGPLQGVALIPGDKSISHRAFIFSSLACGKSEIHGLLRGEDVLNTGKAMAAMGARVLEREGQVFQVDGPGLGALLEPNGVLDFGNAGTGSRLVAGVVASHGFSAIFDGDASLRKRPMGRILEPLQKMGAGVDYLDQEDRMPFRMKGAERALPITYRLPVASAQVKSAVLLAGLNTMGETSVIEPILTRDHTEKMIAAFGGKIDCSANAEGERQVRVTGHGLLQPQKVIVPGDPSSAAFPMVAALLVPGSSICLQGVMINPLRAGLITTLREMGAKIKFENERELAGEPCADLVVETSSLKGVEVPAERAPSMIDEYPVLAVAAAFAEGDTVMRGLHELRVKESDRLASVHAGLLAMGARAEIDGDDLIVTGGSPGGGGEIITHLDHRLAMSFLVMGMACPKGAVIDDAETINTSFPGFTDLMAGLGASFEG